MALSTVTLSDECLRLNSYGIGRSICAPKLSQMVPDPPIGGKEAIATCISSIHQKVYLQYDIYYEPVCNAICLQLRDVLVQLPCGTVNPSFLSMH
jgi:hypothetical protein